MSSHSEQISLLLQIAQVKPKTLVEVTQELQADVKRLRAVQKIQRRWRGANDVRMSRRAAAGRAELLAKSAHAGHLRLPAEPLEVAEKFGKLQRLGIRNFRKMLRSQKSPIVHLLASRLKNLRL